MDRMAPLHRSFPELEHIVDDQDPTLRKILSPGKDINAHRVAII